MPPAEGEATTPAVEAGPEVPEVAVDGEGKAVEAPALTEQLPVPVEHEASTTNDEAPGKESEVESVIEVAKESDKKEKDSQPEVEKEDEVKPGEGEEPPVIIEGGAEKEEKEGEEVKTAETADSVATADNAANLSENVDKQETNLTNDAESTRSGPEEPKIDSSNEPASEETIKEIEDKQTEVQKVAVDDMAAREDVKTTDETKEQETPIEPQKEEDLVEPKQEEADKPKVGETPDESKEEPVESKIKEGPAAEEEPANEKEQETESEPKLQETTVEVAEKEAPVEIKEQETTEPEPDAQKKTAEEEATQETSTQVQETKPYAQAETEHVPECLESSNDTSDAKTVTGSEKSSPNAEKVKADAEKAKEEAAAIATEEPKTQNKAPAIVAEQPAPTDHDYEDVTPLNSVADEVILNTEYEDVTLLDSVADDSVVASLEEKPQPAVPQPTDKTPEPPQSDTVTVPEAAVEGKPEEASTPAATRDVPPVVSPRHKRNRDSFVETKEEIVDDLEFIKAKLATPPTAPAKGKRASKEVAENPEPAKASEEVEKPKEVVENVVEKEKVNESAEEEKAEARQEFARECIPPVRPQRSRTRPGARLSVPDWQPPKQTIFDYLLSCFKPQAQ